MKCEGGERKGQGEGRVGGTGRRVRGRGRVGERREVAVEERGGQGGGRVGEMEGGEREIKEKV